MALNRANRFKSSINKYIEAKKWLSYELDKAGFFLQCFWLVYLIVAENGIVITQPNSSFFISYLITVG